MGMSTYVQGYRPPDEKWREMKAVYDACVKAGVQIPDDVQEFFDWQEPQEHGIKVSLDKELVTHVVDSHRCSDYYDVNLSELPDNITILRFVNSF